MKRLPILWTDEALRNLDEILGFISMDSRERAPACVSRLENSVGRLSGFPESGRKVPELADQSPQPREIIVERYRVLYRVLPARVEVIAVIHGRRRR